MSSLMRVLSVLWRDFHRIQTRKTSPFQTSTDINFQEAAVFKTPDTLFTVFFVSALRLREWVEKLRP